MIPNLSLPLSQRLNFDALVLLAAFNEFELPKKPPRSCLDIKTSNGASLCIDGLFMADEKLFRSRLLEENDPPRHVFHRSCAAVSSLGDVVLEVKESQHCETRPTTTVPAEFLRPVPPITR